MKVLALPLLSTAILLSIANFVLADTLQDVYELALKNDAQLKAAEASYRASIETEEQAFSQMLPQIVASASYSKSDEKVKSKNPRTTSADAVNFIPTESDTKTDNENYRISLEQKVFDLATWFNLKSGKAVTQQAQAQLAADQQALIIRVAEAYFSVLRAKDNLEASKAEEQATKRQLEQTQQRYDVGLIAITDVHESRAVYDNTVVQRLTFAGDLGTAYEALTVLTNHSHNNLWQLQADYAVVEPTPVARDKWVQFALEHNLQLAATRAATDASHQSAKSKKMAHMPTISANYSYNDNDRDGDTRNRLTGISDDSYNQSKGSTWGVTLTIPIYSGGGISSQRRQAYEQYNATLQTGIDTRRSVIQATRSFHLLVMTDVQRVKARARSVISTRSALEATEAGYEVGTRNVVDVLQARRALYASIRDYANSRYDYVLNMLKLKQQAGTLSPEDILALNKALEAAPAPTASQHSSGFIDLG
ncbi:MAG: outer membrane protein [Pseudohongiellaceae bacterium]|jgi:outer membrane protein